MTSPEAVLRVEDTRACGDLYVSFELADKRWKLTVCAATRAVSRYTIAAGDQQAIVECLRRALARFGLGAQAPVHSCYEAGRDGWWLHRWLRQQGIDNIVVDSSSIEVNRRGKHVKTDRIAATGCWHCCCATTGANGTCGRCCVNRASSRTMLGARIARSRD